MQYFANIRLTMLIDILLYLNKKSFSTTLFFYYHSENKMQLLYFNVTLLLLAIHNYKNMKLKRKSRFIKDISKKTSFNFLFF